MVLMEPLALLVLLDPWAQKVHKALLVYKGQLEQTAPMVPRVLPDRLAQLVLLDKRVLLVYRDLLAQTVQMDLPVLPVLLVQQVLRV
jgi:hypothetical protein